MNHICLLYALNVVICVYACFACIKCRTRSGTTKHLTRHLRYSTARTYVWIRMCGQECVVLLFLSNALYYVGMTCRSFTILCKCSPTTDTLSFCCSKPFPYQFNLTDKFTRCHSGYNFPYMSSFCA